MSQEFRFKLLTLTVAIVLSLYLAELTLTLLGVAGRREVILHAMIPEGAAFDRRTSGQVVADMRAEGQESHPVLTGQVLRQGGASKPSTPILPLGGLSGVTTVYCNESGKHTIYTSDRYGFRNPPEAWAEPTDVLMVGDSFTQGACVGPDEEVGALLRSQGIRTINLGYSGNGPLRQLGALKEYGNKAKPRTVLWMYYEGNDVADLARESQEPTLQGYLERGFSQGLIEKQAMIDEELLARSSDTAALLYPQSLLSRLIKFARLSTLKYALKISFGSPMTLRRDVLSSALGEAKRVVDSWGASLAFVYLPEPGRFAEDRPYTGQGRFREEVLAVVKEQQIPVIDFLEPLSAHKNKADLMPLGCFYVHYGAEGYQLLADTIAPHVERGDQPAAED